MIVETDRIMAFVSQIENIKLQNELNIITLKCKFTTVMKKNEFNIGDYCIFITEESVLENGEIIRKMKIGGVLSHGIIIPIPNNDILLEEGFDCTNILKLKKFVKQSEKSQYIQNNQIKFPSHLIPKTDEVRMQTLISKTPNIINQLNNIIITRKEDGSSATFLFHNNKFYICSRNYEISDNDYNNDKDCLSNIYINVCNKFNMRKICEENPNLAFQGEIVGPKINKNKLNIKEIDFRVFNIYDINDKKYLDWDKVIQLCNIVSLNTVPIILSTNVSDHPNLTDELIKLANETKYSDKFAEGIVVKEKDNSISFKVLSENYH